MIKLFTKVDEFISFREGLQNKSIGLVPTMGNLHEGHLSLISESSKENDLTVVTIFVNPLQFGPNEDFEKYPRTLEQDIQRIETLSIEKDILILAPSSSAEIYPENFSTTISITGLTENLCGASRPGHFDGVTTVVYRLFKISSPTIAYFGQKDFQQQLVIKKMTRDLGLTVQIKTMPIIREESGLAKSSRNQYLSNEEREQALELNTTLTKISDILTNQSYLDASISLNEVLENKIRDQRWEYLEILDSDSLQEITPTTDSAVILGALKIGETRLIDNQVIKIQYAR
ncbi:pantoate--beta-alanine ligase [Halobacteriovorax sp. JY17]|uniref:pantoate--beta-alanine ligase n=1 Tax=Halobacteriovorax sp. JY17 TaxID=2014617 RepID=UPI000C666FDA|nr:pantoate--beta-alanine ligase [Halobacteriovorax sp. JY17]PIK14947.1 MAG: pantoate--beta-alanine ligase [Halobacteriovorax sp. JY17]